MIAPGVNRSPDLAEDGWTTPPCVELSDGTALQLHKDGETLQAAYRAIEDARRSIALEVYMFRSDDTGRSFARLLSRRAREGLDVTVIHDAVGSLGSDRRMFTELRAAGVRVLDFHPWQPWRARSLRSIFRRDHRKLLVVDGREAVLGGQNLAAESGSSGVGGKGIVGKGIVGKRHPDGWRDTGVYLRGPSVRVLSEAFARQRRYAEHGGAIEQTELFHSVKSFHDDPAGSLLRDSRSGRRSVLDVAADSAAVLAFAPSPRSRLLPAVQHLLRDARSSLEVTMAYFAPPEAVVEELCRSARDGVRVRLMLPGRSDVWLLPIAARAHYEQLLAAGVEVYERQHSVLHAKTLCVDGRLSIVGSTNLDYRSFRHNWELSLLVHSRAFGAHVQQMFQHDVRFARRILPDEWRCRPLLDRIVQGAVSQTRSWL